MRLVLYLSGRWDHDQHIGQSDLLYCSPGLSPKTSAHDWTELPAHNKTVREDAVEQFCDILGPADLHLVESCFLNDFFDYTVLPLSIQAAFVADVFKTHQVTEILIFAASRNITRLPLAGIKNTEDARGSADCLGSLLATIIEKNSDHIKTSRIALCGDLLSYPITRIATLWGASCLAVMTMCLNVLLRRQNSVKPFDPDQQVVILRSEHHLRAFCKIFAGQDNVIGLVMPRISFTSLSNRQIAGICGDQKVLSPSRKDILPSIVDAAKFLFFHRSELHKAGNITFGPFAIPVAGQTLLAEIKALFVAVFYGTLLKRTLVRARPKSVISFEMKGNVAGIEAYAARSARVESKAVQTILLQRYKMPVFPLVDKFYADSAPNKQLIADNGVFKFGEVIFKGAPAPILDQRMPMPSRNWVFFSQPYEYDHSINIIRHLADHAKDKGATLTIKFHPRDNMAMYQDVIAENDLAAHRIGDNTAIINSADLCLTRASSLAKDVLQQGCPLVLCLWSDFDRGIEADYIIPEHAKGYCATDPASLTSILGDLPTLYETNSAVRKDIFGKNASFLDISE